MWNFLENNVKNVTLFSPPHKKSTSQCFSSEAIWLLWHPRCPTSWKVEGSFSEIAAFPIFFGCIVFKACARSWLYLRYLGKKKIRENIEYFYYEFCILEYFEKMIYLYIYLMWKPVSFPQKRKHSIVKSRTAQLSDLFPDRP